MLAASGGGVGRRRRPGAKATMTRIAAKTAPIRATFLHLIRVARRIPSYNPDSGRGAPL
jgi:hypothetical protein